MSSSSRGWAVFSLLGIAVWVGITVLVGLISDDPADPGPTLIAFAAGGTAFFAVVFGAAWAAQRQRSDPELDALLAELALEPGGEQASAAAIGSARRIARAYIVLGALVTALGLGAIWQQGLGGGDERLFLYPLFGIVVAWAAATPHIVRSSLAGSRAVLEPLGLSMSRASATLSGTRYGRKVRIVIGPHGTKTHLEASAQHVGLREAEILAVAGRGDAETWRSVQVEGTGEEIVVAREGHRGPDWLWDLWLAERLAEGG